MSNAPRVTPEDLDAAIKREEFILLPDGRTTICMLTLDNGFTVRGESSCVCIENYDQALGEKYAREAAKSKLWPLLGFRLADRVAGVGCTCRTKFAYEGEIDIEPFEAPPAGHD